MKIHIAEDEHLPGIIELLATRGWADEFDPGVGDCYIAFDETVIACLQVVDVDNETAVLDLVLVDHARRREGIGTTLVNVATISSPGALYVSCRADAVAFYESLGFSLLAGGVASAPASVKEYWRDAENRAPLAMVKHPA